MSRRIVVGREAIRIEQRTHSAGIEIGTDVSGRACIYAHVRVRRGTVTYLSGPEQIRAPACFELFLPPFTIVQASLDRCDVTSTGFAFPPGCAAAAAAAPVLWSAASDRPPASLPEVLDMLRRGPGALAVGRERGPAPAALAAKALLDREYGAPIPIARVAERIGVTPAALSRRFKESYGMPPVQYRHRLRIMDALLRLGAGVAPLDASLDAGFEDLSRFYKIFRKVACGAPGSYRPGGTRNAKT